MKKTVLSRPVISLILVQFLPFLVGRDALAQGSWAEETVMPNASYGPAVGVIGGQLYVASGYLPANQSVPDLQVYDPVANTWSSKSPIPTGVYGAAAGVIDGQLYVAGGQAAGIRNIATLQIYDPNTDTWTTGASMPEASGATCGGVIDGILYVAGGTTPSNTGIVSDLRAYDPDTDTWMEKAPLPTPLYFAGAAVVNGILYVVGGVTQSGVVNTVEAYDPNTDTWTSKAPMPTARGLLAVAVVGDIIYAVGGNTGGQTPQTLNTVEAYDAATDSWTSVTPMPTVRYLPGAGIINGVLYVVGGDDANAGVPVGSVLTINEALPLPPANPIITWSNPAPITYGLPLTSIQLGASANVSGSFVYDPTNGAVLDAGTNILSVVFTPDDTNDYNDVTDTVDLVVLPAPLTVIVNNTNRPYGGTNPPFSGAIGALVNGDNISVNYSCAATNSSQIGTYPIVPSLVDPDDRQSNYTVTLLNGSLLVTPAPLTVTAADASRLIGAPNPVFTGTIIGLTNGDNISASYSTTATANSPAGTYSIVPSLIDPDNLETNYVVTFGDGTLTVIGPPLIQTVLQSNGFVMFTWTATTNQTYQIQTTPSLEPPNWTDLGGTIIATNSAMTTSEAIGTNAQQFFRIALLP